jgi:hypothetical protein
VKRVHLPLFYFFILLDFENRQANEIPKKGILIARGRVKRRTLARGYRGGVSPY